MGPNAPEIAQHALETMPWVSDACKANFQRHVKSHLLAKGIERETVDLTDLRFLSGFALTEAKNLDRLSEEPVVVRVDARSEADGKVRTYYFGRGAYPTGTRLGETEFCGLGFPLGTIASHMPGQRVDVAVPAGVKVYTVLRKLITKPCRGKEGWDGKDNEFYFESGRQEFATSLKFVVQEAAKETTVSLPAGRDLDSETSIEPQSEDGERPFWERRGITKKVISHADLRLRTVLDEHQDAVQRQLLNSRLLVLGPPGTGKTTTLIKRLGQKANESFLLAGEKALLGRSDKDHARSWVVFTPSELLKEYVRNAFNEERVPAGQNQILTWEQFRIRLKADVFNDFNINYDADLQPLASIRAAALIEFSNALQQHVTSALRNAIAGLKARLADMEGREKALQDLEEGLRKYGHTLSALVYVRQNQRGSANGPAKDSPVSWVFRQAASAFQAFRADPSVRNRFYAPGKHLAENRISPHELDCMFLVFLGLAKDGLQLVSREALAREPYLEPLSRVVNHAQFNQVMVDEVTDFSPIQLRCIGMLAHPGIRSVLACGDFRQRVTSYGIPDMATMNWAGVDFEIHHFQTAYRQSRLLTELAQAIAHIDGAPDEQIILPERIGGEGRRPLLSEHRQGADVYPWLADRIAEIRRQLGRMPSIAIFVDGEIEVPKVARGLRDLLIEHDISIQACPEGLVLGDAYRVRVFDIHHIKGLEFEAAFLLDVDRLTERRRDEVNKFLFVGCTRAATYFGFTCASTLPRHLEPLRAHFSDTWAG